jgi:hypothetical protein
VAHRAPVIAYVNEPLRVVAYRIAEKQFTLARRSVNRRCAE